MQREKAVKHFENTMAGVLLEEQVKEYQKKYFKGRPDRRLKYFLKRVYYRVVNFWQYSIAAVLVLVFLAVALFYFGRPDSKIHQNSSQSKEQIMDGGSAAVAPGLEFEHQSELNTNNHMFGYTLTSKGVIFRMVEYPVVDPSNFTNILYNEPATSLEAAKAAFWLNYLENNNISSAETAFYQQLQRSNYSGKKIKLNTKDVYMVKLEILESRLLGSLPPDWTFHQILNNVFDPNNTLIQYE